MPSSSLNSASDLLRRVRKIEIRTKALSHQVFAGEYHSAFKGRGMAFSEVREYRYGDDVRTMDWNVTARLHSPYVKVFEERIFSKTKKTRITHTGVFGCGFDAVFGEIIRQKQKYPYKPAPNATASSVFTF